MFRKDDKAPETAGSAGSYGTTEPARPAARTGSGEHSVISAGLRVIGNLESDEDVEVRGVVEGDITSRSLTVSTGAKVKGAITADAVNISGTVNGEVTADRVTISKTGDMTGDVTYKTLSIDEGAAFDGQCQRADSGRKDAKNVSNLQPIQSADAKKEAKTPEPAVAAGAGKGNKTATAS
jgi:cytoskeletal protein CcmA (bactofilin family)